MPHYDIDSPAEVLLDCYTVAMKRTHILSVLLGSILPTVAQANSTNFDITAGTQGVGISLGHKINPSVRLRLRGAMLSYSANENWDDSKAQLKLHGNNAGLLVDIFPGEGNFYISAGLNFSENKTRCKARMTREPGMATNTTIGGIEYSMTEGSEAEIHGKYSWNHAQPYVGIGYQESLLGYTSLYYTVDLGINFMGNGNLTVGSTGNLRYRDTATNQMKPVTNEIIEESIRKEGRDFFKIADNLCVYPVLQIGIGARF